MRERKPFSEGLVCKGGVNEQPTTPRPEPPKGQGGVEEPVPASALAELRELCEDYDDIDSGKVVPPEGTLGGMANLAGKMRDAARAVVGERPVGDGGGDVPVPRCSIAELREVETRLEAAKCVAALTGSVEMTSYTLRWALKAIRAVVGDVSGRPETGVEVSDNPAPGGERKEGG